MNGPGVAGECHLRGTWFKHSTHGLSTGRHLYLDAPAILQRRRGHNVDKNRTEGTKHEVKGAVKEVVGKVTSNKAKEVAGNLEKNAGKIQKEIGKAADDARHEADKRRH
jgi:uncharacterized protein YjbJ (UPF0337 family)